MGSIWVHKNNCEQRVRGVAQLYKVPWNQTCSGQVSGGVVEMLKFLPHIPHIRHKPHIPHIPHIRQRRFRDRKLAIKIRKTHQPL